MGPVLLAVLNIRAGRVNTNCISWSHQLSDKVQSTTSATTSLKNCLVMHVIKSTVLNHSILIKLEAVTIELISELIQNAMLHQT